MPDQLPHEQAGLQAKQMPEHNQMQSMVGRWQLLTSILALFYDLTAIGWDNDYAPLLSTTKAYALLPVSLKSL